MNKDIRTIWEYFCTNNSIAYDKSDSCNLVKPYDDSTLFCPSGMQQYKNKFVDESYFGTFANIQSCIRMNDLAELGDDSHLLYFNMIGLFSFREKPIEWAIDTFMPFLTKTLGLTIGHITIHSECIEWISFYEKWGISVIIDDENCTWTDGVIGGYCTEFFIDGIEIGNIVNPLGTCIDIGFGLERLDMFVNGRAVKSKEDALKESIEIIIRSGYTPAPKKQGYVLRKLIRELYNMGGSMDSIYFDNEIKRQLKLKAKYERLKDKFSHMPSEWWYDTHGIILDEVR